MCSLFFFLEGVNHSAVLMLNFMLKFRCNALFSLFPLCVCVAPIEYTSPLYCSCNLIHSEAFFIDFQTRGFLPPYTQTKNGNCFLRTKEIIIKQLPKNTTYPPFALLAWFCVHRE